MAMYLDVVPAPGPGAPGGGSVICFSGSNEVEVQDIGFIPLNQVKVGDYVKGGNDQFTQVYGFGHFDHEEKAEFVRIHFDNHHYEANKALEISSNHLVFVHRDQQQKEISIPAGDVVVGDIVSGKIVSSIVTIAERGVFAPLTKSGDIIVSGIRTSNYVNILHGTGNDHFGWDQHILGHAFYFPQRLFCSYFIDVCKKEKYTNGFGFWSSIIVQGGSILKDQGCFVTIIFSILSTPLVMLVYILETTSIIGLYGVLFLVGFIIKFRRHGLWK